jgi:predicted Zn finger-like uncharacterized protein
MMKYDCPHCGTPALLDDHSAGRTIRCADCGKSFVAPHELAVVGRRHTLTPFPVASLVLLHYVSAGLFSMIYLNLLHERMPRLRRGDPSATVAIGLCFVPVFNLYWFFFTYHRLCLRINEQRRLNGLPPNAPQRLSVPVCALLACGLLTSLFTHVGLYVLGTVGAIAMPIFAALVQHSVNGLCAHETAPAITTS